MHVALDTTRTANLLGAAALAVTDLSLGDATRAAGVSASGGAALVVLSAAPGLSVTELGRRVGLSQSAAARMVDSMEANRLLRRRPGIGRAVTVELTQVGRRAARRLLDAREGPLTEAVSALDDHDQKALAELLAKLLTRLYDEVGDNELMCRLCDRPACATEGATCPVGEAERAQRHQQR
jgi:MarR family transcriptional regulator, negative regulator of the multidrug operon emrRAB